MTDTTNSKEDENLAHDGNRTWHDNDRTCVYAQKFFEMIQKSYSESAEIWDTQNTQSCIDKLKKARSSGINDILIDPGFGFGKNINHNFNLLNNLSLLNSLKCPIVVGVSRKSMIYKTLGCSPKQALNGTSVLNTLCLDRGAKILRVHDVKEAKECISLWSMLH